MTGSPPPMRGKAVLQTTFSHRHRITPAYAGKSSAFIRSSPVNQDHPRLCGEKYLAYDKTVPADGSPPPMRGKGTGDATIFQRCRITPAYAGKRIFPLSNRKT